MYGDKHISGAQVLSGKEVKELFLILVFVSMNVFAFILGFFSELYSVQEHH